jgi:HEPN domain-containing protein
MTNDEKVEYWLALADYDISAARGVLSTGHYLYVGFMCQQAIEKGLKAVIARCCAEGEQPPRSHNLLLLAERSKLLDTLSPGQLELAKKLTPLNIEARYPDYKRSLAEDLDEDNATALLSQTEELLCWIKEQ